MGKMGKIGKIGKVFHLIWHPNQLLYYIICKYPKLIKDDKKYIQLLWKYKMNYSLDLDNPKTFNEKLQWLKLYNRKPEYTIMVDKYLVKEYVAEIIGREYIIPTLAVWNSVDDIDFQLLPKQFVLKCTHDSGGLVICKDKSLLDIDKVKIRIQRSLNTDYYMLGREWPYKNVQRRILAEQYMEDLDTHELRDYKFFCFNGEPRFLFIATGRQTQSEPCFDFFDMDFNHLPFRHGHPNASILPSKPKNFELMKTLSKKLSRGLTHVRVDLYEINGKVYFGELTFFHHSGMVPFEPQEWDYKLGEMIELPK